MTNSIMKKSTINDVAKLANVSRGTVSNFINGKSIRPANKEKIAEAIRQLNYVPNAMARELKTSKSSTVVFIVPTNWTPFFSELIYHMQVELDRNGYKMILANSHADPSKEEEILQMASLHQVTGLITMSYSDVYNFTNFGHQLNIVSIERFISDDVPLITSDNYGGGVLAARKLIERGARRFLLIRRKVNHPNATDQRTQGFMDTIHEKKFPVDIFEASLSEKYQSEIKDYFETHYENDLPFDGIFAVTDEYAEIAKETINSLNPVYKDKVNIIGFDGAKISQYAPYKVDSIRQPVEQIVKEAVSVLKRLIDGEEVVKGYKKIFDVNYVEAGDRT